jgi:RimJ/RimL family protein N-acetyltransferase
VTFEFRPLTESDLPLLYEWRLRPHVAAGWPPPGSIDELREHFLPRLRDDSHVRAYIAQLDGRPIGFIQSYVAAHAGDGWWRGITDPGVVGIDQFLANEEELNRGIGTRMITAFVDRLCRDRAIHTVQVDPAPDNARAIRCYEKVGFQRVGEIDTPDGRAIYMTIDCRSRAATRAG